MITDYLKEDKVYFISDGENIKIGFTKGSIRKRMRQLNTGNKNNLILLGYIYRSIEDEKHLHQIFGKYRFRYNGEWFEPDQQIIDYINEYNEIKNVFVELDCITKKIEVYKAIDLV